MAFLIVGVVLLAMKMGEFGPVASWSWIAVLAPFGLAVLWWAFVDGTGITKRREMDKIDRRKDERRRRDMAVLGLDAVRDKPTRSAHGSRKPPGADA